MGSYVEEIGVGWGGRVKERGGGGGVTFAGGKGRYRRGTEKF